ncbi:hypothetical protein Tco_0982882 [Tanacetum coccineum]
MEISKADQIALDDALVAPANRLKIGKCNLRLSLDVTSKEATLQVVYDVLKLTPFYKAFQVSADVLEIYMQEFWASAYIHNRSVRFKMNNKKHILNLDQFRDILQICPKVGNEKFEEPPLEKEILAFLASLDHLLLSSTNVPKEKKGKRTGKGKQKAKELETISEAVLTEAEQLKIITKRSRKETHSSHASGSGADEGTGVSPGVPDAPDYDSDDDISWKSSEDDQDDDKNDDDENAQDDQDDDKNDDDENAQDDEDDDKNDDDENAQDDDDEAQTESEDDGDDFIHPKLTTHDDETTHEEETDEDDTFDPIVQSTCTSGV